MIDLSRNSDKPRRSALSVKSQRVSRLISETPSLSQKCAELLLMCTVENTGIQLKLRPTWLAITWQSSPWPTSPFAMVRSVSVLPDHQNSLLPPEVTCMQALHTSTYNIFESQVCLHGASFAWECHVSRSSIKLCFICRLSTLK